MKELRWRSLFFLILFILLKFLQSAGIFYLRQNEKNGKEFACARFLEVKQVLS